MADIQYLNYGDQQIEQQAFLNKAANEVQAYVQNQSWSKKRKEKFMSAYSDLMNRGILGASNSSGQWMIDVGGDALPFDTMSEKDKEMYQEAAYFIQQQMQGLPTRTQEEEKKEEDKTKLPLFDNKAFTSSFINHISTSDFGGQDFHIGGENDNWNKLDARDSNGIRGRQKRTEALKNYLISYRDKFDDSKYNFEGSPFENAQDFRNRLDNAINALNTPNTDDDEQALNKLGLNPADWFNNGSGDPSGQFLNNKELTYAELAEYNQKQNELKQQQLKEQARNNFLSFGTKTSPKLVGRNPVELKTKYGNGNGLLNALYGYSQRGLKDLNADELSELQGAYRHLAKDPIDNNLLKQLQGSSSGLYRGASPNRFKKINGIDNFIWDSTTGQVIQIQNRDEYEASKNQPTDLFAGIQTPQEIQKAYMNSTEGGFTPAEQREVVALLFDLGAAADPESVSSTALSEVAAGIRDYNRAIDPEGWTWGDTGWATLDHGLGLLSLIPVAGGWVKGAWALSKLGKYIPKMERWIRLAGRAGSTYAMATNASGALNTLNKIKNGEDLSLQDYQDLAYFFIGGLGHHQLNKSNRTARSAMKARGMETTNTIGNKLGFTQTKATSAGPTPTLKLKKVNEDGTVESKEIPIDAEKQAALSKVKSQDLEKVAKEDLKIDIPEGFKIDSKTTTTKTWSRENINRYRGRAHSEIFGTKQNTPSTLKSPEEFEQYLLEHNNTWLKKLINGSNRAIRNYDRYYLGNNYPATYKSRFEPEGEIEVNGEKIPTYKPISGGEATNTPIDKGEKDISRVIMKRWRDIQNGVFSKNSVKDGKLKIGNENVSIYSTNNLVDISTSKGRFKFKTQEEAKKFIASLIKEQKNNIVGGPIKKSNIKEFGKILQDLKRKGWLKEGGTIDRQKIQNYKEFINK